MHALIHLRVHYTIKFVIFDDASKCFAVEIYNPLPVLWKDFKFPV